MQKIRVTLSNRFAKFDCDAETLAMLRDYWAFYPPGYRWAPAFKLWLQERKKNLMLGRPNAPVPGWDGKIRMLHRHSLPAGLFRATREEAESELDVKFLVTHTMPKRAIELKIVPITAEASDQYSYQADCVTVMQKAIRRGGGIVLSATGSGKTKIAGDFFRSLPGLTCLFIVDTVDLLDQSQKEIAEWAGEEVGKVGEMEFSPKRITVGTIQTLDKHKGQKAFTKWFQKIGIVVVDELHDLTGKWNAKLLNKIRPIAVYGLTATLQLSKKDIRYRTHSFAGPVIFEFPLAEGVKRKVLKAGRVVQFLLPPLKIVPGTSFDAYRQQVVENTIKHDVCYDLVKELITQGRVIIVMVERIAHLRTLDKLFENVPHEVAYGPISKKDRQAAVLKIENVEVPLIIANKVFRKGINIKRVDAAIDLAERKDKNSAKQQYGRLVRLHPDKEDLLYIDIGTQRTKTDYGYRASLAALSRRRAFVELKLPVQKFDIEDGEEAVKLIQPKHDRSRIKKTSHY